MNIKLFFLTICLLCTSLALEAMQSLKSNKLEGAIRDAQTAEQYIDARQKLFDYIKRHSIFSSRLSNLEREYPKTLSEYKHKPEQGLTKEEASRLRKAVFGHE